MKRNRVENNAISELSKAKSKSPVNRPQPCEPTNENPDAKKSTTRLVTVLKEKKRKKIEKIRKPLSIINVPLSPPRGSVRILIKIEPRGYR